MIEVPTATAAQYHEAPLSAVTASPTPRMHITRTETGQCGAEC
ncbi:hypothetical protein [Acrocarpospora catenulata]|nr:hypothetical protein [Acrocarpospora catenulata]